MAVDKIATKVWQNPIYFIAFGFGSGLMPVAPGTWGTIAAIPIYILLMPLSLSYYLIVTFVLFLLGVWVSEKVSRDLGVHDFSGIVWDEVIGYLLTMVGAPKGWVWMLVGFLLFRLFDIWKPTPIRLIDRHVQGGLGIMLDDVAAALPAWACLQGIAWIFLS
jgi:phosphatidylglycerophosphatase A